MTTIDWIRGILIRPSSTYQRASSEMRLGYWWILMAVCTLEVVIVLYSPTLRLDPAFNANSVVILTLVYLIILFDIQAILLLGAGRLFGWQVTWVHALKVIGLSWSVLFLEDIITFYPSLKGLDQISLWMGVPMFIWYLVVLTFGVRSLSGLSITRSAMLVALASIPWRGALFWLYLSAPKGTP
jgi:hypothetical protein